MSMNNTPVSQHRVAQQPWLQHKLLNYDLTALLVSPWAWFCPATAPSHTDCGMFSVPVCYPRKIELGIPQYELSLLCVQTKNRH